MRERGKIGKGYLSYLHHDYRIVNEVSSFQNSAHPEWNKKHKLYAQYVIPTIPTLKRMSYFRPPFWWPNSKKEFEIVSQPPKFSDVNSFQSEEERSYGNDFRNRIQCINIQNELWGRQKTPYFHNWNKHRQGCRESKKTRNLHHQKKSLLTMVYAHQQCLRNIKWGNPLEGGCPRFFPSKKIRKKRRVNSLSVKLSTNLVHIEAKVLAFIISDLCAPSTNLSNRPRIRNHTNSHLPQKHNSNFCIFVPPIRNHQCGHLSRVGLRLCSDGLLSDFTLTTRTTNKMTPEQITVGPNCRWSEVWRVLSPP